MASGGASVNIPFFGGKHHLLGPSGVSCRDLGAQEGHVESPGRNVYPSLKAQQRLSCQKMDL